METRILLENSIISLENETVAEDVSPNEVLLYSGCGEEFCNKNFNESVVKFLISNTEW